MNVAQFCAVCGILVSVADAIPRAPTKGLPLKQTLPWYHSADELHAALQQLVGQCGGANLDISQRSMINTADAAGEDISIDVVHIGRQGQQPKTKAMLVFGEHARELISPESALHLVQTLCGSGPAANRASSVLDNVAFVIVPNANPLGRKTVEEGYYCKRTNEDGVDLNRNFGDEHRGEQKPGDEQNPGPHGFSEPESRMLKALVEEERPDIYLSVHSGAYLLGTPFGYTSGRVPENNQAMLELLRPISEKYCGGDCPYGNLAKLINYENPGCDVDYVSEQVGVPYVFTWEIYVGESFRAPYLREARTRRDLSSSGRSSDLSVVQRQRRVARSASKLRGHAGHLTRTPEENESIDSCIEQFNPQTQEETLSVIGAWTSAYLELCEDVSVRKATANSNK